MVPHAHFYWGNTTLPWFQYLAMRSFLAIHPGWQVTLWRPRDQTVYEAGSDYFGLAEKAGIAIATVDPDALTGACLQGYDSSSAWCQVARSDALRHHLLYEHGGLWSDVDVLYFYCVEGSSIDQGDVSLVWVGDDVHTAMITAQPKAKALEILLERQRALSPAYQAPGGQSPFGPGLWLETFGAPNNVPGFHSALASQFMDPPSDGSYAYHCRGARIPWASLTIENYRERIRETNKPEDAEAAIEAIRRVLPVLG